MAIEVRNAVAEDAEILADLGAKAFTQAYGRYFEPDDLAMHLDNEYGPEVVRRELSLPTRVYLIVETDGQTAGFTKLYEGEWPTCVSGEKPIE